VPEIVRWYLFVLVWSCVNKKFLDTPAPVGFALLASIMMLGMLAIVPLHPMSIPVVIGGGISVTLILWGGCYVAMEGSKRT